MTYLTAPLATEAASSAALSVLRVPLGSSDFSASTYTFDDEVNDTDLSSFSINSAPSYLWSTIQDIRTVTQYLKLIVLPWSAPAWMKTSSSINGGSLMTGYEKLCEAVNPLLVLVSNTLVVAQYLFKAVQALAQKGLTPYAVSCQNEPQNSNPTYPTMLLSASQEALVGSTLRSLLDSNGYSSIKIIAYDHNWDNAGTYPVQVVRLDYHDMRCLVLTLS